jgi:hypothetical protein
MVTGGASHTLSATSKDMHARRLDAMSGQQDGFGFYLQGWTCQCSI